MVAFGVGFGKRRIPLSSSATSPVTFFGIEHLDFLPRGLDIYPSGIEARQLRSIGVGEDGLHDSVEMATI